MLAHERQEMIIQMMQDTRSIRISEIAERFSVSLETARRDLEYLQKKGLLRRVHGGATLESSTPVLPAENPSDTESFSVVKRLLGQAAAELVHDGDTLFIGSGTTMQEVSRSLRGKRDVTVMTYSIASINELIGSRVTIYSLGGLVDHDEQNMGGSIPIDVLQQFYANKAFLSCGGVSSSGAVSDYSRNSALQRLMMQNAEKKYLIVDSSKFGRNAFCKVCELRDFDTIVTDSHLPQQYRELIEQQNVDLVIVDI